MGGLLIPRLRSAAELAAKYDEGYAAGVLAGGGGGPILDEVFDGDLSYFDSPGDGGAAWDALNQDLTGFDVSQDVLRATGDTERWIWTPDTYENTLQVVEFVVANPIQKTAPRDELTVASRIKDAAITYGGRLMSNSSTTAVTTLPLYYNAGAFTTGSSVGLGDQRGGTRWLLLLTIGRSTYSAVHFADPMAAGSGGPNSSATQGLVSAHDGVGRCGIRLQGPGYNAATTKSQVNRWRIWELAD
jgi:hypothetical protein